jgi:hypothetical protein
MILSLLGLVACPFFVLSLLLDTVLLFLYLPRRLIGV